MPWIINGIGAAFIGFALGGCGDMALTYLQDSYQEVGHITAHFLNLIRLTLRQIIGDALVGVIFVRNALATILIFAIPPWVEHMGVYDMYVVLAVLSTAVALTCVPFCLWGPSWRAKLASKYECYAERQI